MTEFERQKIFVYYLKFANRCFLILWKKCSLFPHKSPRKKGPREKISLDKKIPGKMASEKRPPGKKGHLKKKFRRKKVSENKVPEKWSLVKKSRKKRSLLKEWSENLPRKIKQFLYFYRLIPPDGSTHTKRYSTLTPRSHIHQTVRNMHARTVFLRTIF